MLEAARRRPLIDGLTIRRGPNKGELLAKVSDERRAELEQVGRERALIYKMGVLTGLWANELRTLQVNDLSFGDLPFVKLRRSNEKSRKGSTVPLRSDLAAELRRWAQDKPPADRLFNVPTGLLRIMNRDLVAAGIPKVDEDGYVVHIHALRHSFGTHLSKAGVSPRTAQAAMRHSDIKLTMSTYVDARLLDTASAVELLPSLPLEASGDGDVNGADSAENSASEGPRTDAPTVAPNVGDQGHLGSILGHCGPAADSERKRKNPEKLNVFQGFRQSGRQDLNLRPLRPERIRSESNNTSFAEGYNDAAQAMHHWMHQILNSDKTHALDELAGMLYGSLAPSECYQLMASIHERIDAGRRSQRET